MTFYCIMVLYNINYKNSITYNDLLETETFQNGNLQLICVDNSTSDYQNECLSINPNQIYLSMHGNQGLSKAYNKAISYLRQNHLLEHNLIVLLDDDTHIDNDYFQKMTAAYKKNAHIYLPIVTDQEGYLSPSIMGKFRCRRCRNLKEINKKNICGINSGMAIRGEIFLHYSYDENLFLDYVDHNFIRDMKEQEKTIMIVDTGLEQNFSSITDNYEQTLTRFQIMYKDIKYFYSRTFSEKLAGIYVLFRRKFGIALRFKKFSIFKIH